jgi:hypothetical protein
VIGEALAREPFYFLGNTIQVSAIRKLSTFLLRKKMLITGYTMMVPLVVY